MKILLIESDVLLAKTIASLFAREGHQVVNATDAQAAISVADQTSPDLIILDLQLAGHSGVEFLYELRSYPDWQKLPVVIYSNLPPAEAPIDSSCFEQLEIRHYFYKPTTKLSDLLATVNGLGLLTV